jgi:hypothetical protein
LESAVDGTETAVDDVIEAGVVVLVVVVCDCGCVPIDVDLLAFGTGCGGVTVEET